MMHVQTNTQKKMQSNPCAYLSPAAKIVIDDMAELQDSPESAMKVPKTSRDLKIEMRRKRVRELLTAGRTISKIAAELGYSRKIISKDIKMSVMSPKEISPDALLAIVFARYESKRAQTMDVFRNGKTVAIRLRAIKLLNNIDTSWQTFLLKYGFFQPAREAKAEPITVRWLMDEEKLKEIANGTSNPRTVQSM